MNEFTFEDAISFSELMEEVIEEDNTEKIDYCAVKNGNTIYPMEESYMKLDNSDKVLAFLWENSETIMIDNNFITRVSKKIASLNRISASCPYTVVGKEKINDVWVYNGGKEKNVSKTQAKKILDNLQSIGIMVEDDKYYYLDVDFEKLSKYGYSIIDDNTSEFLAQFKLKDLLKVYTYLFFRFKKFKNFTFTKKNLAKILGYQINKHGSIEMSVSRRLGDILYLLSELGFVEIEILYKLNPQTGYKYRYFLLKNVAKYDPKNNKFNQDEDSFY